MRNGCIKHKDGHTSWYKDNVPHREDGPAIEYYGDKYWYLNGKFHRVGGPALECVDGTKCWYQYGKLHCEDGPAVISRHGEKYWYLNDKKIDCSTQEEFLRLISLKVFW